MKTPKQHFYDEGRKLAETHETFMELVNHPTNPLTREDLQEGIRRRPSLWKRYEGFLNKLPTRAEVAAKARGK